MSKSILWSQLAVLSCATLIVCFIYLPRRVPNLPQAKSDVMHYVAEGKYNQDLQQASWQGRYFLNQYTGSKPAIVFDIDETVLSNYKQMKAYGFGGDAAYFRAADLKGQATQISPVYQLYQAARKLGYHIHFITGRRPETAAVTERNLKQAGYLYWDSIDYWPDQSKQSIQAFKSSIRQRITEQGETIVLSVGDQHSDLRGGFTQHQLKLPNPFYTIPGTQHR